MGLTTMGQVRRLVAEGNFRADDLYIWVCPMCCTRIAAGTDPVAVNRTAISHCLVHACFSDSVTDDGRAVGLDGGISGSADKARPPHAD